MTAIRNTSANTLALALLLGLAAAGAAFPQQERAALEAPAASASGQEPTRGEDAPAAAEEPAPEPPADEAPPGPGLEPAPPPLLPLAPIDAGAEIAAAGGAAAWADFDGDRVADLSLAGAGGLALLRGDGDGGFAPSPLPDVELAGIIAVAWADFDNDADLDLFLGRSAGHADLLLVDQAGGEAGGAGFAVAEAGDLGDDANTHSSSACWADLDGDGHLDLFVVRAGGADDVLYRNLGDGTFAKVEGAAGGSGGDGRACAAGDLDGDGRVDLFVGNFADGDRGAGNFLYVNRGDGRFDARPFSAAATDRGHTTSVALIDYDYDLDLDLLVTNAGDGESNVIYLNDGSARFSRVFESPLAELPAAGQAWGDLDNDGRLDVFLAGAGEGGRPNALFLGDGKGGFAAVAEGEAVTSGGTPRGAVTADFDRDGDLDLLVVDETGNRLYENPTSGHRWLALRLEGTESNRMGLGTRVTLDARVNQKPLRLTRWLLSANAGSEPLLHFGLGERGRPVKLEIAWPSGRTDKHENLQAGRVYLAVESGALVEQP